MIKTLLSAALFTALAIPAAHAQTDPEPGNDTIRVRVGLGAKIVPKFPGASEIGISPYPDFAIARGDEAFPFESPDEAIGFPVFRAGEFEAGPAITFQGKRRRSATIVAMDEIGFSLETGGFIQYWATPSVRVRAEARYGVTGHGGMIGSIGADYVARKGDDYVFSIGPRVNLSDSGYQRAYFGVNPGEAARTGLPVYRPGGGVHSVGVIAGANYALTRRWGLVGFAQYDRLTGDAADSPFIATHGSRDQFSTGLGITYTFGRL